ncbi:MAG TPA: globin domain-containing protein [Burkholderiales bacterium]|nr:globin domain-containing protein [Burkholderiales bacterium]
MTPEEIQLVKTSFDKLAAMPDQVGEMFYQRLFELDPNARQLFWGNMREQGKALFLMLDMVVNSLDIQDKIVPIIFDLGKRHAMYGVRDRHYQPFEQAMMDTLSNVVGSDFTPDVRKAWSAAFAFLADIMKEASARPAK